MIVHIIKIRKNNFCSYTIIKNMCCRRYIFIPSTFSPYFQEEKYPPLFPLAPGKKDNFSKQKKYIYLYSKNLTK